MEAEVGIGCLHRDCETGRSFVTLVRVFASLFTQEGIIPILTRENSKGHYFRFLAFVKIAECLVSPALKGMLKNANVVGQNVVKFRHQAGWTQEVLAAKMQLLGCYMTREIIANIETRRSPATDKRIVFLAKVLGVEIGWLFPKQHSVR